MKHFKFPAPRLWHAVATATFYCYITGFFWLEERSSWCTYIHMYACMSAITCSSSSAQWTLSTRHIHMYVCSCKHVYVLRATLVQSIELTCNYLHKGDLFICTYIYTYIHSRRLPSFTYFYALLLPFATTTNRQHHCNHRHFLFHILWHADDRLLTCLQRHHM